MSNLININEIIPTKSNIETVGKQLSTLVREGHINPIEFQIKAKWLKDMLDAAMKSVQSDVITEIEKYGKDCTVLGAKLEVVETGTKYDYSCDEKWNEINDQLKPIQERLKEQEEMIKMATKIGADSIDTDTGEVIARKVIKVSTTSPKVTLGK